MAKILTFDLEIETPVNGDWEAARTGGCGISVLVVKDSETGLYHIFDKRTLDAGIDLLNSADLLVSYNGISFDAPVIFGVSGRYLTAAHYDILDHIWSALHGRAKGYKLDEVARATIGMGKSSNGEYATTLVKQKRWAELHSYCLADVHLTAHLFDHIMDSGFVKGTNGIELFLEKPILGVAEYA